MQQLELVVGRLQLVGPAGEGREPGQQLVGRVGAVIGQCRRRAQGLHQRPRIDRGEGSAARRRPRWRDGHADRGSTSADVPQRVELQAGRERPQQDLLVGRIVEQAVDETTPPLVELQ